jgi:hypothetical protein
VEIRLVCIDSLQAFENFGSLKGEGLNEFIGGSNISFFLLFSILQIKRLPQ